MRSRKYLCQHGIMESWIFGTTMTVDASPFQKGRKQISRGMLNEKDEAAAREAADERARKRERERIEAKAEKAREAKKRLGGGTAKCARRVERLFQIRGRAKGRGG